MSGGLSQAYPAPPPIRSRMRSQIASAGRAASFTETGTISSGVIPKFFAITWTDFIRLDLDVERTVSVVLDAGRPVADGIAVDGICHEIKFL